MDTSDVPIDPQLFQTRHLVLVFYRGGIRRANAPSTSQIFPLVQADQLRDPSPEYPDPDICAPSYASTLAGYGNAGMPMNAVPIPVNVVQNPINIAHIPTNIAQNAHPAPAFPPPSSVYLLHLDPHTHAALQLLHTNPLLFMQTHANLLENYEYLHRLATRLQTNKVFYATMKSSINGWSGLSRVVQERIRSRYTKRLGRAMALFGHLQGFRHQ